MKAIRLMVLLFGIVVAGCVSAAPIKATGTFNFTGASGGGTFTLTAPIGFFGTNVFVQVPGPTQTVFQTTNYLVYVPVSNATVSVTAAVGTNPPVLNLNVVTPKGTGASLGNTTAAVFNVSISESPN